MAEHDENENRNFDKTTEVHVCKCKRKSRNGNLVATDEPSSGTSSIENSALSKYSSDSDDSVFLNDDSEDETLHRKSQTLTFRRKKNDKSKDLSKKRKRFWTFRFKKRLPVRLRKHKNHGLPEANQTADTSTCVCTGYRRTEDHVLGAGIVFNVQSSRRYVNGVGTRSASRTWSESSSQVTGCCLPGARIMGAAASPSVPDFDLMQIVPPPQRGHKSHIDFTNFNPEKYPTEDIDDILIAQRARDIELGIEVDDARRVVPSSSSMSPAPCTSGTVSTSTLPVHYRPPRAGQLARTRSPHAIPVTVTTTQTQAIQQQVMNLSSSFQTQCVVTSFTPSGSSDDDSSMDGPSEYTALSPTAAYVPGRTVHTQVDYIHCLVPDLLQITNCSFYWGVMDRYEAEKLLENRPEGTFLLRDSAQEEFLFSVSFRRYGRSLHARIEQWKHKFSFDSHDPGVFASQTVCGLIEHYKDPSCCMFFEPMLTLPLNRTFPFSLQHLCRAVICSSTTYDGVSFLPLPKSLRQYLKYYHYKQKVRVRKFECSH